MQGALAASPDRTTMISVGWRSGTGIVDVDTVSSFSRTVSSTVSYHLLRIRKATYGPGLGQAEQ